MNSIFLLNTLHLDSLLPEGILILTLLTLLVTDLLDPAKKVPLVITLINIGLAFTLIALLQQWPFIVTEPTVVLLGSFKQDILALSFRMIILITTWLSLFLSTEYMKNSDVSLIEFVAILLTATLGSMLLAGSNDVITAFVSLETLSLSSYLLSGYMKKDNRSNEAALKYLILGSTSSAFLLYGFSLLYGLTGGEIRFDSINIMLITSHLTQSLIYKLSLCMILAGLAFKLSLVPFHQWTPDVYEGSPSPVTAFLSVGSKAAGFVFTIRLLVFIFQPAYEVWQNLLILFSISSMILGNTAAISQTSIKRMLGYSTISQAGFMMIGIILNTQEGYQAMITYLIMYLLMNLGAFGCIILFSNETNTDQIADYSGLYEKDPGLAFALSTCLLSLGGIPPLAGFFGKLYLFWSAWCEGYQLLVIVGLITSVISIYYYLRIIKMMFTQNIENRGGQVREYENRQWSLFNIQPLEVTIIIGVVGSWIVGIYSIPILNWTNIATQFITLI